MVCGSLGGGKLLEMDERKVMIWFQNKRQRVKQKQRENDNSHLKNTNAQLTHELESEKRREFQLVQSVSVGEVARRRSEGAAGGGRPERMDG